MKAIVLKILKVLSGLIVRKYKPDIIGVTGSVGKTSTKEAIYTVLASKFALRRSVKSYNNEIGVPLTIIGAQTANRSIAGWIGIFFKALGLIFIHKADYPKVLVLEMGSDRPGDIAYLKKMASPKIGVITAIAEVHLESFGTVANVVKEKQQVISDIASDGYAVLNGDDERVAKMRSKTKGSVLTYGFEQTADMRASEDIISTSDNHDAIEEGFAIRGTSFKLMSEGSTVPVFLPGVLGRQQAYAALAAAAIGQIYGMNLVEISKALSGYQSPAGRMRLIPGIKRTLLIDDTYNASPRSTLAALDAMRDIRRPEQTKKIAVLGDMLELGSYSEEGHREVGAKAAGSAHMVVAVGERARDIARGARENGLTEGQVFEFTGPEEAGRFVQERMDQGDLILVKGSQGARMEKVVKELMAEPLRAKELLVRQDASWSA